ncbi:MAG: hypothetical protein O9284_03725 [Steroidobacteraceae bacterium]|jgi:hypothetical protein|nr:hypothetical protein [Steroidobacteraceae bacterium]
MTDLSRREFVGSLAAIGAAAAAVPASASARDAASRRLYTPEQLELMATPLSIRLERAVAARDPAPLAEIRAQMDLETLAIYDAYMQWVATLQTFILARTDDDRHDEALRQMSEHSFRDDVLGYRGLPLRAHVERLAERLRASGSTFRVEEDAERVRFSLGPWAPVRQWLPATAWQATQPRLRDGNRYFYPTHGAYAAPTSHAILGRPRPTTQSRAGVPCFLATEVLFLEILPIELLGYPIAVVSLPERPDATAYLDVYKDASRIPEQAYARVGLSKPRRGLPAEIAAQAFTAEELERLGTPLSIQVEQAAAQGDWDRLRRITQRMDHELVGAKDPLGLLIAGLLTWIARNLGEDAAEASLVRTAEVVMAPYVGAVRALNAKDAIAMWAMVWRSHGSTFSIEETDQTFVLRGRPLGACHRMWSSRYAPTVERISGSRIRYPTFGAYQSPMCCHLMREPRGITWGKTDYPIYSTHCHMLHEIYPIDQLGHPLWVEYHPLDDPDGETVHVHYKNPADWPAEAYERVGRRKPVSQHRRA